MCLERLAVRESATEEPLNQFLLLLATFTVPLKYFPSQRFNHFPDALSITTILSQKQPHNFAISKKNSVSVMEIAFFLHIFLLTVVSMVTYKSQILQFASQIQTPSTKNNVNTQTFDNEVEKAKEFNVHFANVGKVTFEKQNLLHGENVRHLHDVTENLNDFNVNNNKQ